MRKIVVSVWLFVSEFVLFAQSPSIRLGVLKGISCAPCAYLMENRAKLSVQDMEFALFDSAQSELPKLLRGELDAGFLAPADAAKVFTAGNGAIVALGVAQNGACFLVTGDESYSGLADLKGKPIVCAGNDSPDNVVFTHVLSKQGIAVGSGAEAVQLDFSVPVANVAAKLISGEAKYALLPEPFAALALKHAPTLRRAENLRNLYAEADGAGSYPAMLLVVRADFADANRELLSRFMEVYKTAAAWTNKNPAKAALLAEKHRLGLQSSVAVQSIPHAALTWREARSAKPDLERLLSLLLTENPASVGGELPKDGFYF